MNPANSNLLMTSSNDWTAKIFDLRNMSTSVDANEAKGAAPLQSCITSLAVTTHQYMSLLASP